MRRMVISLALCLAASGGALGGAGTAAAASGGDAAPAGIQAVDAQHGCFTAEPQTPRKSGSTIVAGAFWACNAGSGLARVTVELQQSSGTGVWTTRAQSSVSLATPFARRLFSTSWTCPPGTGSKLYRTRTWAATATDQTPAFFSPQVQLTCP
jgi:hypothetical protein